MQPPAKTPNVENEISTLAQGAGIAIFGKFFGRALHVLTQIIMARLLGPASFGIFALAWSLVRIIESIGPLGMHQAAVRFGSESWEQSQQSFLIVVGKIGGIALVIAVSWGLLFFAGVPALVAIFDKPELDTILPLVTWLIPLVIMLQVISSATRASKRMKYATIGQDLGQPILSLVAIIIFVIIGQFMVPDAVLVEILSYGGALTLTTYFLYRIITIKANQTKTNASFTDTLPAQRIFSFALPASMLGVFVVLTVWGGRLMVGYFLPASDLGIYQAISQISVSFSMVLAGINAIFSPMIAALYAKGKISQLAETFRVATKWGVYLSIPVFLVIMVFPAEILDALFGSAYTSGAIPLQILALAQLVNVATGSVGFMLVMTDRQSQWMWITASALLLNLGGGVWAIPRFGLIGAASISAVATIWMFGVGLFQVYRDLHLWPYDKRFWKGAFSAVVAFLVLLMLKFLFHTNAWITVGLAGVLSITVFFAVLWLGGWDTEDKMLPSVIWKQWQAIRG